MFLPIITNNYLLQAPVLAQPLMLLQSCETGANRRVLPQNPAGERRGRASAVLGQCPDHGGQHNASSLLMFSPCSHQLQPVRPCLSSLGFSECVWCLSLLSKPRFITAQLLAAPSHVRCLSADTAIILLSTCLDSTRISHFKSWCVPG